MVNGGVVLLTYGMLDTCCMANYLHLGACYGRHMSLHDELSASRKGLSVYYSSLSLQSSKVFDKRLLQC